MQRPVGGQEDYTTAAAPDFPFDDVALRRYFPRTPRRRVRSQAPGRAVEQRLLPRRFQKFHFEAVGVAQQAKRLLTNLLVVRTGSIQELLPLFGALLERGFEERLGPFPLAGRHSPRPPHSAPT